MTVNPIMLQPGKKIFTKKIFVAVMTRLKPAGFPASIKFIKRYVVLCCMFVSLIAYNHNENIDSWIRINQLGYIPDGIKVAVWVSKENELPKDFHLVASDNSKVVFTASVGKAFGRYGPFIQSCR